ncbi:MAG: serpin family protein [Myxococcales bacterium]|nr:serpin family protein [Myxococcales bacterium]
MDTHATRLRILDAAAGIVGLLALTAAFVPGCVAEDVDHGELLRSSVPRDTTPDVAPGDLEELVRGNTAFGLDLYARLVDGTDGNLFFSPLSLSEALAMTYGGARGETARQMAETLHFTLPPERLHPAFNALDLHLEALGEGGEPDAFQLHVVNQLWGQTGYEFLAEFLDLISANYGAGMRLLDFAADQEASRLAINDWVAEQTRDRILDLLPVGSITALTRLVLTNAIYFKASWQTQFDPDLTRPAPFHRLDGSVADADLMRLEADFPYAEGEGWQAVDLPYEGGQVSMVVVLPAEGTFAAFEAGLDSAGLAAMLEALASDRVALAMPKFTFTTGFEVGALLAAMGMPDAFDESLADFGGIEPLNELYITRVIHKAFVGVDETGTEAAAATAVVMDGRTSVPPEPRIVTLDRPFLFLIRDVETGTVLFFGRVLDPTA